MHENRKFHTKSWGICGSKVAEGREETDIWSQFSNIAVPFFFFFFFYLFLFLFLSHAEHQQADWVGIHERICPLLVPIRTQTLSSLQEAGRIEMQHKKVSLHLSLSRQMQR